MGACTGADPLRVLALGNDLLADDAFGFLVARALRQRGSDRLEIVETIESGLRLLDHLVGASRLVVVDTVKTGTAEPGTLYVVGEEDVEQVGGSSPHSVGLFDTLMAGRALGLPVPESVTIVAVEAADVQTIGGRMNPGVEEAVPAVCDMIERMVA